LIVFNVQDVVGPPFCQVFGDFRLAEDRIAGDDFARHRHDAQQLQRRFVFVGFGIDSDLTDNRLHLRGEQRQQMRGWHLAIVRTPQGFAIEGEVFAEIGTALENPISQDSFKSIDVESSEGAGVRCGTGCFAASESEGMSEGGSVIASKLSDALKRRSSGENGYDGERENRDQIVNFALGLARIYDTSKHVSESKGHGPTSFKD